MIFSTAHTHFKKKIKNSCFLFLEILKLSPDLKNLLDQQSYTEDVFAAYSCQLSSFFFKSVLIMLLFSKWRILYYIYKPRMRTLFLCISFTDIKHRSQPMVPLRDSSVHMSIIFQEYAVLMNKIQNHLLKTLP